jgi:hypothetical protein
MTDDWAEPLIRQAIGGNRDAIARICIRAYATDDPLLLVTAALLARRPDTPKLLDRAAGAASYREDRQLVAIARAHLAGDRDLVDALARDHLTDFPGNYLVAWIASGAVAADGRPYGAQDLTGLSERGQGAK